MTPIKNRVRHYRQLRGLTLDQLAELSDLSMSQLSKIETFEPGWSMDSLLSIARALNISVASLLDESENPWRDYMERRFSRLEEKIDAVLDALRHKR